ncbi:MAG: LuxR family transcriptional regulator [Okeania sp. SIO2C9]|nr:LuxR family transcriptional regulator [Okeania sp. SIO2C9]
MGISLSALFQAIAQAEDEQELRQTIMAQIGNYFAAKRWGLTFLDQLPAIDEHTPAMIKRALSLDYNPVLRYVVQRHAAVHDEVMLPPGVWQRICPRIDHGHVMLGPIVSNGQLVGGIAFTRDRYDQAFNADNLADLNALCLHLSTRLAVLRSKPFVFRMNCSNITPREAQIAELVARGFTNSKIGATLWITENSVKQALKRMFRKLGVSSRAEMVAKLCLREDREQGAESIPE